MSGIITAVGQVVTGFVGWFGDIATELIANDLVLLILGVGITTLVFGLVMGLVSRIKAGKRKGRR